MLKCVLLRIEIRHGTRHKSASKQHAFVSFIAAPLAACLLWELPSITQSCRIKATC